MTSILTTKMDMVQALVSLLRWEEYEKTLVLRQFELIMPLKWLCPQYINFCLAGLLSTFVQRTVEGPLLRMNLYAPSASMEAACCLYAMTLRDSFQASSAVAKH